MFRQFSVVCCSLFHSSNFCEGKSHEKQPRQPPRSHSVTLSVTLSDLLTELEELFITTDARDVPDFIKETHFYNKSWC